MRRAAGESKGCGCGDTVAEEADTQAMLAAEADRRGDAVESAVRKRVVTVLRWLASRLPAPSAQQGGGADAPTPASGATEKPNICTGRCCAPLHASKDAQLARLREENANLRDNLQAATAACESWALPYEQQVLRCDDLERELTTLRAALAQESHQRDRYREWWLERAAEMVRLREGIASAIRAETCRVVDGELVYRRVAGLIDLAARIESGEIPNPTAWGLDVGSAPAPSAPRAPWWRRLWQWARPLAAGAVVAALITASPAHAGPRDHAVFAHGWSCEDLDCRIDDQQCWCYDPGSRGLTVPCGCPIPTPTSQTVTLEPPLCGRIERPGTLTIDIIHCTPDGKCGCGHPVDWSPTPTPDALAECRADLADYHRLLSDCADALLSIPTATPTPRVCP